MASAQASRKQQATETEPEAQTALVKREPPRNGGVAASDLWYDFARSGQRATLEALRNFVDVAVPIQGGKDSRRRKLIDGAFAIADTAGALPLEAMRGATRSMMVTYFDVVVNVNTDVDALREINVGVNVPTNVDVL